MFCQDALDVDAKFLDEDGIQALADVAKKNVAAGTEVKCITEAAAAHEERAAGRRKDSGVFFLDPQFARGYGHQAYS